ncbi:hypothetical protein OAL42_00120 [Akkermansiaceae bacterium]|nr:hypothetical protein [Akkermansiaceae bacterium]
MKVTLKKYFFKIAGCFPKIIGDRVYHQAQKLLTRGLKKTVEANKRSFEKVEAILKSHKIDLVDKRIVEVGSGWRPIMPYFFKILGGCECVSTYDVNKHFNKKWIKELNEYFFDEYGFSGSDNGVSLPSWIKYFPKTNISKTRLSDRVDLVFSRFVLEHVSPVDMIDMHKNFFKEFSNDTLILHLISPGDHRAYDDNNLSHYDFLKYSQLEWDRIQTRFDYHNRLRLPQYLKIFEETGFEVVSLEYEKVSKDSEKYAKFSQLNIHSDFEKFSEEEILAGSINVLLRKRVANYG